MKRITVLKRKMKKKLTVRTLSFIMAAGLLLLVVPFVAIASGREDPEPGKKGDFRLLRDFYAVTQITLEENMETAPVVTAENSNAASYQWQAYSREREQYVDLSGKASQQMELTEALAKQYDYGNGRSYFRCLATDAEGSILISDVLTVVAPMMPEAEKLYRKSIGRLRLWNLPPPRQRKPPLRRRKLPLRPRLRPSPRKRTAIPQRAAW